MPMRIDSLPTKDGATQFGSHFHKEFQSCHYKHWLSQAAPHPNGGTGIRHKDTPSPLLIGSFLHSGMESLRRGIVRNGEWNTDEAIVAMEAAATSRADEGGEHLAADLALAKNLIINYRDYYGPRGDAPEGKDVEVALDGKGEPIIEREYRTPLPGIDAIYTCRVDMMARWQGWLRVWEVKTSTGRGGWIWKLFDRARWDLQMTGEVYTLRKQFPDEDVAGVLVDALIKDRGANSKMEPCYREQATRTEGQLDAFERLIVQSLFTMEECHERHGSLVSGGMDPWDAAEIAFPRTGMANGKCVDFNRNCAFLPICEEPERAKRSAAISYRPRTSAEAKFRVKEELPEV